jgi:uncharacterized membrane protein
MYQDLKVEILEGPKKGEIVIVENDFLSLREGETFFLNYLVTFSGEEIYSVREPDRRMAIWFFVGLFALTILLFGRLQGLRSLLSLIISFLIIVYLLLPSLLAGHPPVLTSAFYAFFILAGAIYLTHGINRESHSAFLGTAITVSFTGVLAYFAVYLTRLSGFASDEAIYLNLGTAGRLDFEGLLLGAIIIGILGVLDDISISQAHTVRQIHLAAPHLPREDVFRRALAVGREHVGALVNTLALAYAGVSLPLLMLFSISDASAGLIINREIFATEIIRTVVGSIGLIVTVPVTTWLATVFIINRNGTPARRINKEETDELLNGISGHSHGHTHN